MYPTEMAEKSARDAEEKYLKLEALVRELLERTSSFNDGCECCASQSVCDTSAYKAVEEFINQ